MEFGPVPLAEAEGAILAHSLAAGAVRLKKGTVLTAAHLAALAGAGVARVTAARPAPDDVGENEAARRLGGALLGAAAGLRAAAPANGRVNIYAGGPGIVRVDAEAVLALNRIDPAITLATVPEWQRMGPGGMVATIKIIPYAVPEAALQLAEAAATGALALLPPVIGHALLIVTTTAEDPGERAHRAIRKRLDALGATMERRLVPHEAGALAAALAQAGPEHQAILILTASATSDARDVAPAALVAAGGRLDRFGMPVDPGNLLFLGRLGARPVIGLPGCARSPALNGADFMLERIACGIVPDEEAIAAMGIGGLLKEIPIRPQPREKR